MARNFLSKFDIVDAKLPITSSAKPASGDAGLGGHQWQKPLMRRGTRRSGCDTPKILVDAGLTCRGAQEQMSIDAGLTCREAQPDRQVPRNQNGNFAILETRNLTVRLRFATFQSGINKNSLVCRIRTAWFRASSMASAIDDRQVPRLRLPAYAEYCFESLTTSSPLQRVSY